MNKKYISLLSVLIMSISLFIVPLNTKAKTLKEFEDEVNRYTAELQAKKDKIAKNNAEVAEIKKKIANIESQIKQAETDIANLEQEIKKNEEEIVAKKEESKKIMEYYQIANGDNAYLEYAFGATSITDMIYRMSIVEQLTEYNDTVMKELRVLIQKNKEQTEALDKKKVELDGLKKSLQSEKEKIDADTASIRESMPSVENQIKEAKANVAYFKRLGCGATEDILACQYRQSASLPSVGAFSRPMTYGYVTRGYSKYGHIGYDLSSSNKSIEIYPIAAGKVHAIYSDDCVSLGFCSQWGFSCNGNAKIVVIQHNNGGRYVYSTYVHLRSYGNISVGQYVDKNTVIGYMGSTGCSTGSHLHIEVANCHWKNNGGCTYGDYESKIINPGSLVNFPSRWDNR